MTSNEKVRSFHKSCVRRVELEVEVSGYPEITDLPAVQVVADERYARLGFSLEG